MAWYGYPGHIAVRFGAVIKIFLHIYKTEHETIFVADNIYEPIRTVMRAKVAHFIYLVDAVWKIREHGSLIITTNG